MIEKRPGIWRMSRRAVSYSLIGLLALNADAGWAAMVAPASQGGLTTSSDPAGADVFVDGQYVGKTPVTLEKLTPGDHQVRLVKNGYLENGRTVTIGTEGTKTIHVTLTAQPESAAQGASSGSLSGGGGGKKKWIFIGLGATAVGAGTFLYVTRNKPPVPGTIGVSPSGTGMAGLTAYTFSSTGASDPNGDTLSYNWKFSDGGSASGQSATHTFNTAGTFTAQLAVSDGKKSVSAPDASVTVGPSLTGSWTGGREPFGPANVSYNLTQTGTTISGTLTFSGNLVGTLTGVTGTVDKLVHPANVTITSPGFGIGGYQSTFVTKFVGTTNASGTSMTGTMTTTGSFLITQPTPITTTFTR